MKIISKWITSPRDSGAAACTFRKCFKLKKEVQSATLYASAIGIYVPYLNGNRIGENVLAPGWTSYNHRVQYQNYDITSLVTKNGKYQ